MAVAIDAGSPAITGSTTASSRTTASFTAPANSVLVACIGRFATGAVTMSNSGTALTWSLKADDSLSRVYTALNASSQSTTVTFNNTTSTEVAIKVYAITGADTTNPVGATGTGTSASGSVTVNGYVSTVPGSLGICSAAYIDAGVVGLSSSDDESAYVGSSFGLMGIAKSAPTGSAGTTVTFNMVSSSPFSPDWEWAAVEIVPPGGGGGTRPVVVSQAVFRASSW